MSAGNSIYAALSYNLEKVNAQQARVIFTNKMMDTGSGIYDMAACLRSFESRLMANQRTEKPVLHISLNPDPKDKLSDEQLSQIAEEYMQKMAYANQPYIVFKHEDIDRHHIHIVSLRVDETGKKIDDRFEHRRSMDACRALEQAYGLIPAYKKQRQEGLPLKPVRYEEGDVKHQIANIIRPLAQSYHFQSLKEYKALLTLYNIGMEEIRGEVHGKLYQGLVYSALDSQGEKAGNPFKASIFGHSVGLDALQKRIEKSTKIIKEKGLKERTKKAIAAAIHSCNNRPDFEKALAKQGLSVLFRQNDEGRIYGATFIDHEQKAVFNGSRLGKEFSANAFNDLFKGNHQEQDAGHTFVPFDKAYFDLLTPEAGSEAADNAEEEAFQRQMKRRKKKKRQRHL